MYAEYTEDQASFRAVVARFMADKSPAAAVRSLMTTDQGYDRAVWRQLCTEVGLAGIHIPEAYGGSGFGPVELGIVAEEMGRHLYCGPFFASSVMAGLALLEAADEPHRERLLPQIASGECIATLVLDDLDDPAQVGGSIAATVAAGETRLTGCANLVIDAHVAELLIVAAAAPDGLALFAVPSASRGVRIGLREALDPTRKLCRVRFDGARAEKIGEFGATGLPALWDRLSVVLAHEMIGGAQRLLDSTVEYTKLRYQFGRPIGSFQALKHRCADLLIELELAKPAVRFASQCLAAGGGEPYAASMAKALAGDAYMEIARAAIQLRGGIGFTWEEDTHLWFKRAKSSEVLLGSPHFHRERMIQIVERTTPA